MNKPGLVLNKMFYHTVGRLSDGISMTLDLGLTSGRLLDYIYENKPSGWSPVGRWLDRQYIEHPSWKAVRSRKHNVETALKDTIFELQRERPQLKIVDIAAGYAAYLFSVASELRDPNLSFHCYDLDERWVASGNEKARRLNLERFTFTQGDTLDPNFARTALKDADIVIASGFYDWITDDTILTKSLDLVSGTLADGRAMVLTYQMSNPALEMVEYVFNGFTGEPLRMKMRNQAEMSKLLKGAGIQITKERVDQFGFYNTVQGRVAKTRN